MFEQRVQIKRYPNRRFYDRNASKYVSLEDIENLVQAGQKVEIRDSQTGDEITRSVLTRILLERQPDKMLLFPTDLLHFILRANDVSTTFLRDYFQHSLTYLDYLSRHGSTASTFARPMHWVKAWLDSIATKQPESDEQPTDDKNEAEAEEAETASDDEAPKWAARVKALEERIQRLESQGD